MKETNTILYVDDEPINLQVFEFNFYDKYKIITAESGTKGLELLKEHEEVDVVISDMKMPHMDGIAFIKEAHAQNPTIPFFILTGFDITPEIERAIQEGMVQKYLGKPFDLQEIENALESALKK